MQEDIARTKWPDFGRDLESAAEWMDGMGLRSRPSRIGRYAKAIRRLAHDASSANLDHGSGMSKEGFAQRVGLAYEVHHIPRIYRAFVGKETPGLRRRLRDFLAGPLLGIQERTDRSSNRARNIGFELAVGALFAEAGMAVTFPEDPDSPDLVVSFKGMDILIECKRPQTLDAVRPRLREGLAQLAGRYASFDSNMKATRGLVAMSLGKAFNPDMQLLPVSKGRVLKRKAEALGNRFWSCYNDVWTETGHPQTIGVILNLDFPAVVESDHLITYCADSIVTNVPGVGAADITLLRDLADEAAKVLRRGGKTGGSNRVAGTDP